MMANPRKFQYMLLGKPTLLKMDAEGFKLESAKAVKLLGLPTDHSLTLDTHVSNICKTANAKINKSLGTNGPPDKK